MNEHDMNVWASDLRDKYGIAWPVSDEEDPYENELLISGYEDPADLEI